MKNEPKRHHYIPQFIIRNFSNNELGFVRFYNKKSGKFSNIATKDVFVFNDLYRDEINTPNEPTKIEKDFSKYEGEIARLLKDKFLCGNDITLTTNEYESLFLFIALMQFRSKHSRSFFDKTMSEKSREFYKQYQPDGDYLAMWKRNLGYIVNCRSIDEVLHHSNIDLPFKSFMVRDTFGLTGLYLIVAERRGNEDFFLGDAYPVTHIGEGEDGISLPLLSYFPISPSRLIATCSYGVENVPLSARYFDEKFLARPKNLPNRAGYIIHVRKIYEKDVRFINDMIYKNTIDGAVVFDENKFFVKSRNVK